MERKKERSPSPREILNSRERYWKEYPVHQIPSSLVWAKDCVNRLLPGSNVLDVGCGKGIKSRLLVEERNVFVTGIDINLAAIEWAKNNNGTKRKKLKFLFMNGTDLKFPDSNFDAVVAAGVVGIEERKERKKMLREFFRVVKPGGMAALAEFEMYWNDDSRAREYLDDSIFMRNNGIIPESGGKIIWKKGSEKRVSIKDILFITKHFQDKELVNLLSEAGFSSISVKEESNESRGPGDGIMESRKQITVWGFKPEKPSIDGAVAIPA